MFDEFFNKITLPVILVLIISFLILDNSGIFFGIYIAIIIDIIRRFFV